MQRAIALLAVLLAASSALAQDADDAKALPPIKPIARLLPPKGVDIGKDEREKLEARLAAITKAIKDAKLDEELGPDVEIYTKAVRWAIDFDEFYDAKKDIAKAHAALDSAQKRLDAFKAGKATWPEQRGLLARGYRSEIDDSVQPYGLHIPANLDLTKPVPLLVWLHGRGDKETDLHFIAGREKSKGEFAPDWCITLHPYGRGTIGFKFAGEIDVLDAIESVKKRYKIDEDRIALAGFSMGGAGAWHIGAHYADKFCVVHAGAGFVETAKYNRLTPDKYPAWYEQKLWGWYDVPNYTRNLFNVPVIAYSGENDKQIQAAREMEAAFKAEGRTLNHIIGPGVEHKYEPKAKEEVLKEIKAAVDKGRDRWPKKVSLQTRTAMYGDMHWIRVDMCVDPWQDTRVDAELVSDDKIVITTKNVADIRIRPPWPRRPANVKALEIVLDGKSFQISPIGTFGDNPRLPKLFRTYKGEWMTPGEVGKLLGYNGARCNEWAIDHAFMTSFVVVAPSKPCSTPEVQRWVDFELAKFVTRWRATFRGDVRLRKDGKLIEGDEQHIQVLWGDPQSNPVVADLIETESDQIDDFRWGKDVLQVEGRGFPAANHILLGSFFEGHIILNSGPTFREGHDRTNSQQTPKLPDWAIIGLDKDPDALSPGEIKAAGFFDENWQVKKEEKK